MDRDGLTFINARDSQAAFDVDGDGSKDRLAWMGKDEAMLVYDHDQDGQVTRFNELAFGSHLANPDPNLPDLQALARPEFDTNQDGVFDARDAKWSKFALWQDKDSDGVVDPGEMQGLDAAGVRALALHANVLNHAYGPDVTVRGFTRVTMKDGAQLQAGDVFFNVYDPSSDPSSITPPADANASGSAAQWIDLAQAQALTDAWQRSIDAQLHAGSTRFAGSPPGDLGHKALVGQLYSFVLPDAWLAPMPAGGQVQVLQQDGRALPAWLSYDAASHTLSGTPALAAQGLLGVQIRLRDAAGMMRSSQSYGLEVAQYNQAPEVYGDMPLQFAAEDQPFELEIAPNFFVDRDAMDRQALSLTQANGQALPDWLQFDPVHLRLSGTPTQADVGSLDLRLTATDAAQASASETLTLHVSNTNDAPVLVRGLAPFGLRAAQSNSYVLPMDAFADADIEVDVHERLTLSVNLADGSALPSWLAYTTATHTLLVTPPAGLDVQPFQLRVTATDFSGASVSTLLTLAQAQWGSAEDDNLVGGNAGEYLWGEAGNDTLNGMAGADTLMGGPGNDVYMVDALDTVVETFGEGTDTVSASISYTLGGNLENLVLTGTAAINGTGNALANVVTGNAAANTLDGGAGDDTLKGGAGDDIYILKRGSGRDLIQDMDTTPGNQDTLLLGANIAWADLSWQRQGNHLLLSIKNTTDQMQIQDFYLNSASRIEKIQLSTGESQSLAYLVSARPTGNVTISGTATQGQTMTASQNLADADGMGTVSWQWLADGVAISGATSSSLTLAQTQVGKTISARASYTDGFGVDEAVSSAVTTAVANVNDLPSGTVTITGAATQYQTLTASHNLADVDGLGTINWQWLADGVAIAGATGSSLTLAQAQVGKAISVRASYTDGFGVAEAVSSVASSGVANVNDLPTGNVTVTGTATQGQTLTASQSLADVDGLGTINWQWLADGAAIAGATGSSLTLAQAQVGKAISVRASYTDGFGVDEAVDSAATAKVIKLNDLPTGSVSMTGTVALGQTLMASHNLADADGMGAVSWQWLANGVAIAGATGSTYTLAQAQMGTAISVRASYTDGWGTAESVSSAAIGTASADVLGSAATPLALAPGVNMAETVGVAGDHDWYRLSLQAGWLYQFDQVKFNSSLDAYLRLRDVNGTQLAYDDDSGGNLNSRFVFTPTSTGTYYLDAGGYAERSVGAYVLSFYRLVRGSTGNDALAGTTDPDRLAGMAGQDVYTANHPCDLVQENANEGTDTVNASVSYTLPANVENLTLTGAAAINGTGNELPNTLVGNAAANTLDGGVGNDSLDGGAGSDVLTGGSGADRFVFSQAWGADNLDTIVDFSKAQGDTIALDDAVLTKLLGKTDLTPHFRLSSQAPVGGDDHVVYNPTTGQLLYDASGNGTGTAQLLATLANKPQDLTAAQFVVI